MDDMSLAWLICTLAAFSSKIACYVFMINAQSHVDVGDIFHTKSKHLLISSDNQLLFDHMIRYPLINYSVIVRSYDHWSYDLLIWKHMSSWCNLSLSYDLWLDFQLICGHLVSYQVTKASDHLIWSVIR